MIRYFSLAHVKEPLKKKRNPIEWHPLKSVLLSGQTPLLKTL